MPQNLSSGFLKKQDSNQSPQLQRLARNFACSKPWYDILQRVNNKGANQSAPMRPRMRRLVCAFVVGNPKDRFSPVEAHMFM